MNKILKVLKNPYKLFVKPAYAGKFNGMSDEKYISLLFRGILGRRLDLKSPKSFNEKLQWLKLYDRNPEYVRLVDKYLVREYIANTLGEEYLIPLLGVWEDPDDIDFDALPDRFVLKCNHNSGVGMCICKDKSSLDIEKVKRELRRGLEQDYYLTGREWPYKDVPRRIICEQFMTNGDGADLSDFKFQCFNGKLDNVFVCTGRFSEAGVRYHYFDRDWNYLPYCTYPDVDPSTLGALKPKCYDKMLEIAEMLAKDLPQVRVDLYEINGRIYFGELTFFSQSGFDTDITYEADMLIGSHFTLPEKFS